MPRKALIAVGCFVLLLAAPAGAREHKEPLVIRGDVQMAGFKTTGTLGDAIRVFGAASSRKDLPGYRRFCAVTWDAIGLEMRFFARGCSAGATFVAARAFGARWQTLRGLRIGDPARRVLALYPAARLQKLPDGGTRWVVLRRGTMAGLAVTTKSGRAAALVVAKPTFTITWSCTTACSSSR